MHGLPPRYGVRTNPTTGKSETYELLTPVNLEESRKELRDFITGNYQWHDDPYAIFNQAPKEPVFECDQDEDWIDVFAYSAVIP